MNRSLFVVMFLLTLMLSGCGNGNTALRGTVVFSDDGTPLSCGIVIFDNGNVRSKGIIRANGTYTVGTASENDGIPQGTYNVSISGAYKPVENTASDNMTVPEGELLIDKKYINASTSDLTVTVDSKTKLYDIKVDRPKK